MKRQINSRMVGLLFVMGAMMLLLTGLSSAAAPPCQPPLTERQRYGFVASSPDWAQTFDISQIRAGWYVDFAYRNHSLLPEGMDRALVLHTTSGYRVEPATLGPVVDRYPGAMWLVGNEPDCIWQDNVWPEEYARIYHDLYTFIKNRDSSSLVAPGGIVQATPLRLEYLERTLAAYQAQYGQAMPVDLWNIHNAILNEQQGSWGADIPPGIAASEGVVRAIDDNDDMTIFADQIWAFRQWMADNGYGGYPLIVTEYGVLMPDDYGFDVNRVKTFMTATFDFFETATDPVLGNPSDGNRLVQRWAWFSLNTPPWNPITGEGFNGNLFDPDTTAITAFGQHYASRTSSFPPLAYVDLTPSAFRLEPTSVVTGSTPAITRTLEVRIANGGTVDSGSVGITLAYDGPLSGTLETNVANVAHASAQWVPFTLTHLLPGSYSISVEVDPDNLVAESLECNNQATTILLAPTDILYLPVIGRQSSVVSGQQSALSSQSPISNLQPTTYNLQSPLSNPQSPASAFQEFDLPAAGSYPAQIALDAQGGVWISERDGNRIARFDPVTLGWDEYSIPTPGSQPWGITLDAAGNVWFAETAANQIGKLVPSSGTFTEYAVPTTGSEPWDVTIGGSGSVWFTEKSGNKIGKLVPSLGVFTEYALHASGSQPTGIDAYGSYVWFTEAAGDRLGRLDSTTGKIIEKLRPSGSLPQDIALTTAGKPWFTEPGANRIVLFDPSTLGWVLEVEAATADSEPYNLTVEGNVAIWFTERAGNKLGRFSGSIPPREFSLPTPNSLPTGIALDGANCAWYTAPGVNRIGQFCPVFRHVYLPVIARNQTLEQRR